MIGAVFVTFLDLFVALFNILIIIRVIGSYALSPNNRFYAVVVGLTEPILAPVRRVIPPLSGVDLSPLAAFVILNAIQYIIVSLIGPTS